MMRNFVFACVLVGIFAAQKKIQDKTIYKITNKSDSGVLTLAAPDASGSGDLKIQSLPWTDAGGQKWKSKQALLDKSFEFKPTSNDKALMDGDADLSNVYARTKPGSKTKYWYVKDMGGGTYQIKNHGTQTCITSQGLSKPVKLMSCDNSPAQQWIFTTL